MWEPRASYLHAALAVGVFYHFCLPFLSRINRFCINMLWMTRTNNTSVIFFFLALTPSDLFKQTTPQQSWPINHLNGLKTYLMSLTNHFMKCHCSSWQDFLLHTSSLFCFTLCTTASLCLRPLCLHRIMELQCGAVFWGSSSLLNHFTDG